MGQHPKKIDEKTWLVSTDSRGRISLGPLGFKHGDRFRIQELPGGNIRLIPVVVVEKRKLTTKTAQELGVMDQL